MTIHTDLLHQLVVVDLSRCIALHVPRIDVLRGRGKASLSGVATDETAPSCAPARHSKQQRHRVVLPLPSRSLLKLFSGLPTSSFPLSFPHFASHVMCENPVTSEARRILQTPKLLHDVLRVVEPVDSQQKKSNSEHSVRMNSSTSSYVAICRDLATTPIPEFLSCRKSPSENPAAGRALSSSSLSLTTVLACSVCRH